MVMIYEFFYLIDIIVFESWCIISYILRVFLFNFVYFFIGFCLVNIDEIFESYNNVSFDLGFV